MPTAVVYNGIADRREVTKADLEHAGVKDMGKTFEHSDTIVFAKRVPQEVNNEIFEALTSGEHFSYFDEAQGDEEPEPERLTDSVAAQRGSKVAGGGDGGTGTASATTSGTTGTGTTAASTGR